MRESISRAGRLLRSIVALRARDSTGVAHLSNGSFRVTRRVLDVFDRLSPSYSAATPSSPTACSSTSSSRRACVIRNSRRSVFERLWLRSELVSSRRPRGRRALVAAATAASTWSANRKGSGLSIAGCRLQPNPKRDVFCGATLAGTECGDGQDLRDIAFGQRAEVLEDRILMSRRDRATEQQDVGRLTVHRDDRRVGGRHHLQLGVRPSRVPVGEGDRPGTNPVRSRAEDSCVSLRSLTRPSLVNRSWRGFQTTYHVGRRRSDTVRASHVPGPGDIVEALNPLLPKRPSVSPPCGSVGVRHANR